MSYLDELHKMEQKILRFMETEFIQSGFMYDGCIEASARTSDRAGTIWPDFNGALSRLVNKGLIQRRDCQAYAFELPLARRNELIVDHNLLSSWYDDPPYPHRTHVCAGCGTAVHEDDLADGSLCHIFIKS